MKKVLLAIAAVALIGLASCSKEKTCKCTTKDGDGNVVSTNTYTINKEDGSDCSKFEAGFSGIGSIKCK